MLFRMILDGAKAEERPIARGFLRHIVAGFAGGLALGGVLVAAIFLIFSHLKLDTPLIFIAAMLLQFGPIGGLVGAGIYLSRITERSRPDDEAQEEDDDDRPGGGTRAPVGQRAGKTAILRPARSYPLPAPA